MNFGNANMYSTSKMMRSVRCESTVFPGHSYLFAFSKDDRTGDKSYWRCCSCRKLYDSGNRGSIGSITVLKETNVILSDPQVGHHPNCQPIPNAKVEADSALQKAKNQLRRGQKRPREAYTQEKNALTANFSASDNYDQIMDAFQPYKKIRRSLYNSAVHETIPIQDPRDPPEEYRKTYLVRMNNGIDDPWLLHSSDNMLVFASSLDLEVLHNSYVWIMDGTFKSCPSGFKQLYTLRGYGSFGREAMPLVLALLDGKTQAIYEELFRVIVEALRQRYNGEIGRVHTVLCDFEAAAHQALRNMIPGIRIRGCLFHLGQALVRMERGTETRGQGDVLPRTP